MIHHAMKQANSGQKQANHGEIAMIS